MPDGAVQLFFTGHAGWPIPPLKCLLDHLEKTTATPGGGARLRWFRRRLLRCRAEARQRPFQGHLFDRIGNGQTLTCTDLADRANAAIRLPAGGAQSVDDQLDGFDLVKRDEEHSNTSWLTQRRKGNQGPKHQQFVIPDLIENPFLNLQLKMDPRFHGDDRFSFRFSFPPPLHTPPASSSSPRNPPVAATADRRWWRPRDADGPQR